MDIETLRSICLDLPGATEGIKWGNDLCFMVAEKMFCVSSLDAPLKVSLKVRDDEFDEVSNLPGIIPAPYMAKHKWILIGDVKGFTQKKWKEYIRQSYDLVVAKLPKKTQAQLKG
jgi:predicted DNA-binding protein (MmcQ/YjbR family)